MSRGLQIVAIVVALLGAIDRSANLFPYWITTASEPACEVKSWYDRKNWFETRPTATWSGPCVDGLAEGRGVLEWFRNGTREVHYKGEMSAGRLTGRGVLTDAQGNRFDGEWKDGTLQYGMAAYASGRRFEGEWYKGGWSRGVLTTPAGLRMEGNWYDGKLDGRGVAEVPGGRYEGEWYKGKPEGRGVAEAERARYDGEWHEGLPEGRGVLTSRVGERYEGVWKKGCLQTGDVQVARAASASKCFQ